MVNVLVVYYSRNGSVRAVARMLARGVNSVRNCEATLRSIAATPRNDTADTDDPEASLEEIAEADAVALGGPAYFGGICTPVKNLIDQTTTLWLSGSLVDKPAAVFTSSGTMHGGNETVLVDMMRPLLHHGMIIVGVPYTEPALSHTLQGGTPYGASHVSTDSGDASLSRNEAKIAFTQGVRLARIAKALKQHEDKNLDQA